MRRKHIEYIGYDPKSSESVHYTKRDVTRTMQWSVDESETAVKREIGQRPTSRIDRYRSKASMRPILRKTALTTTYGRVLVGVADDNSCR
ncbi:hypothetical protein RB195_007857 [Necator americanus]